MLCHRKNHPLWWAGRSYVSVSSQRLSWPGVQSRSSRVSQCLGSRKAPRPARVRPRPAGGAGTDPRQLRRCLEPRRTPCNAPLGRGSTPSTRRRSAALSDARARPLPGRHYAPRNLTLSAQGPWKDGAVKDWHGSAIVNVPIPSGPSSETPLPKLTCNIDPNGVVQNRLSVRQTFLPSTSNRRSGLIRADGWRIVLFEVLAAAMSLLIQSLSVKSDGLTVAGREIGP